MRCDLSNSLIWLFSTPLCTFQGLDLDLLCVASSSLSRGSDLINLFVGGLICLPTCVCIVQPCWVRVLKFPIIQETSSVQPMTACLHSLFAHCSWYVSPSLSRLFHLCAGFVYQTLHKFFHWVFPLCAKSGCLLVAKTKYLSSLNPSKTKNTTHTLPHAQFNNKISLIKL